MIEEVTNRQTEAEVRIARARRAKLARRVFWWSLTALVITGGVFALVSYIRKPSGNQPGQLIADQGRDHVSLGSPFSYNSNPPTSGPHFATPADWGVSDKEIPDQILIHNLEHGGILIAYKPGIDAGVVKKLEAIAKDYGRKVVMAPRSANDSDVALAAWNHLDKFSAAEFSEERVRNFVDAYRNRGPEFVP